MQDTVPPHGYRGWLRIPDRVADRSRVPHRRPSPVHRRRGSRPPSAALAIVLAFAVLGAAPARAHTSPPAAATSEIPSRPAAGTDGTLVVTLGPDAPRGSLGALAAGAATGVTLRPLGDSRLAVAHTGAAGRRALEALPWVQEVRPARRLEYQLATSVPAVGADTVVAGGITGAGAAVAIIDSGVDTSVPALDGAVVAEACYTPSLPAPGCPGGVRSAQGPGSAVPCALGSNCSHGTWATEVMTSDDPTLTGVAPGVSVVAVRVTGPRGDIDEPGVLEALGWIGSVAGTYGIRAVNVSLGTTETYPKGCTDAAWQAVLDPLLAAGVVVVVASGNGYATSGLSFPACMDDVVAVGATDGTFADVAAYTNTARGLDLLAPGGDDCTGTSGCDRIDLPDGTSVAGTSFASPHVAAGWVLAALAHPSFGLPRLEGLLASTGDMVTRSSTGQRFPFLRVDRAVAFVPFADVSGDAYWVVPADWAKVTGLSTGTGGGLFEPASGLTRAQAVTFLWRYVGRPTPSTPAPFPDVERSSWYTSAVDWAADTGVTTGTGGGLFEPDGVVTRAQMATFLWRVAGRSTGWPTSAFADVAPGTWYTDAVDWLAANGITTGTSPTTFSPDDPVTRAQMVTFLWRLARTPGAWSVSPPAIVMF